MDPETLIERRDALVEAEVAGELVGLDIERGSCFGFNATATRIWQLLDRPRTLAALCNDLVGEYEVDYPTCLAETAAIVRLLADEHLVALQAP